MGRLFFFFLCFCSWLFFGCITFIVLFSFFGFLSVHRFFFRLYRISCGFSTLFRLACVSRFVRESLGGFFPFFFSICFPIFSHFFFVGLSFYTEEYVRGSYSFTFEPASARTTNHTQLRELACCRRTSTTRHSTAQHSTAQSAMHKAVKHAKLLTIRAILQTRTGVLDTSRRNAATFKAILVHQKKSDVLLNRSA